MKYLPNSNTQNIELKETSGKEWMFIDGTEYVGIFHIYSSFPFSGSTHTIESVRLYPYTNDVVYIEYLNLKTVTIPNIVGVHNPPTKNDYDIGFMIRYFCSKRNENKIVETDKNLYNKLISNSFYKVINLEWKITGPIQDVVKNEIVVEFGIIDTNRRTLQITESKMPGISLYLKDLTEYAR